MTHDALIELVGLKAAADKQIRYFSSGMKQRLKLALAIFSDTPILLLDEPCSDLERTTIYNMLEECTNEATQELNLRTLIKLLAIIRHETEKPKETFQNTLTTDEELEALIKAINSSNRVEEQIIKFKELTGKGRSAYFITKRKFGKSRTYNIGQ